MQKLKTLPFYMRDDDGTYPKNWKTDFVLLSQYAEGTETQTEIDTLRIIARFSITLLFITGLTRRLQFMIFISSCVPFVAYISIYTQSFPTL